jgi:hypothetical protein
MLPRGWFTQSLEGAMISKWVVKHCRVGSWAFGLSLNVSVGPGRWVWLTVDLGRLNLTVFLWEGK